MFCSAMTAHVYPGRSKSITLVLAAAITVVLHASLAMVLCQIAGFFFYDLVSAPKAGAPNSSTAWCFAAGRTFRDSRCTCLCQVGTACTCTTGFTLP